MKKLFAILISIILIASFTLPISAKDVTKVYVSIADGSGTLQLIQKEVVLTDTDNDGALTINDAFYLAHEQNYKGGASAGYATATTTWGESLTKLWGVDNGGWYVYYVNNAAAMGLAQPLNDGDYLEAFCFTDLTNGSDVYSYFTDKSLDKTSDEEFEVTLKKEEIDYTTWASSMVPAGNATITIDGVATDYVTDANGVAKIKISKNGEHIVSAKGNNGEILMAPALKVTITGEVIAEVDPEPTEVVKETSDIPATGEGFEIFAAFIVLIMAGIALLAAKKHEKAN